MSHEMWLMQMSMAPEYKEALELLPLLPGEGEGYTSLYKTMQELMLPLDTSFECEQFLKDTSWEETRHALRRVSLRPSYEHPFENVHKKSPAELFEELPEDVKDYIEACPRCIGCEDPRRKFTRAVVFWNEYYKDLVQRSQEPDEERERWVQGDTMDEFMQSQKPRIMEHFKNKTAKTRAPHRESRRVVPSPWS